MAMVAVSIDITADPTLEVIRAALETRSAGEPLRGYIGASSIGEDCARKIWYGPRIKAKIESPGCMAIEDGHRTEDLMAERLRMVPGIELWTHTPDKKKQYGFDWGFMRGHYDGVIKGLLQAPETPHVWECKTVNERKFNAFRKIKAELGEKATLAKWDTLYYAQAVIYMEAEGLTRHYLTVLTPGGRDMESCRTEANPKFAKALIEKAKRIHAAKEPPERISQTPDYYVCKMCRYKEHCWTE